MSKTLIPPREWQEAIGQLRLLPDGDCKIIVTRVSRVMLRSSTAKENGYEVFFTEIRRMLKALGKLE